MFVAPVMCWLVPVAIGMVSNVLFPRGWDKNFGDEAIFAILIFWLLYLILSALFCGFAASFFLRLDGLGPLERNECLRRVGCWIRGMFLVPLGVLFSWAFCCAGLVLVPLHLALWDFAFSRGLKFWNSDRPRQWIGDFDPKN